MKNVSQMINVVKKSLGVSKDKEVEEILGIKKMGLASLKRENRVGSFLKFLVPFCEDREISIDRFLLDYCDDDSENEVEDTYVASNTNRSTEERDQELETLKDKLIEQMEKNIKITSINLDLKDEVASLKAQLLGEKPPAKRRNLG